MRGARGNNNHISWRYRLPYRFFNKHHKHIFCIKLGSPYMVIGHPIRIPTGFWFGRRSTYPSFPLRGGCLKKKNKP